MKGRTRSASSIFRYIRNFPYDMQHYQYHKPVLEVAPRWPSSNPCVWTERSRCTYQSMISYDISCHTSCHHVIQNQYDITRYNMLYSSISCHQRQATTTLLIATTTTTTTASLWKPFRRAAVGIINDQPF